MSEQKSLASLYADSPMLWFLLPFVGGIVIGDYVGKVSVPLWSLWAMVSVCLLSLIIAWRWAERKALFFFLLLLFWGLLGATYWQTQRSYEPSLPQAATVWRMTVDDVPKATERGLRTIVQTAAKQKVNLFIESGDADSVQVGDVLLIYCQVKPLKNQGNPGEFDYARYLRYQGVIGTAYCSKDRWEKAGTSHAPSLHQRALLFRQSLSQRYAHYLEGEALSVLSALTLGDKHLLQKETRHLFSETGASHVLALSGLHLGILYALFQWLVLKRCYRRRWKVGFTLFGLALLWGYALLVGFPLSIIRACIMFTMGSSAGLLRRDVFSLNNLGLAALLILLWTPHAVFDIGFQLSFLSVASILLLMPLLPKVKWIERRTWARYVYESIGVTLAAQIGTLPLVAYIFHTLPVYGVLTNLLIIPIVTGLIGTALVFFFIPWGQNLWAGLLDVQLKSLFTLLRSIAQLPCATIEVHPSLLTTCGAYALLLGCIVALMRPTIGRWCWCFSFGIVLGLGEKFLHKGPSEQYVFYSLRHSAAIHFIVRPETSYLWMIGEGREGDRAYLQRNCWTNVLLASPQSVTSGEAEGIVTEHYPFFTYAGRRIALADSTLLYTKEPRPMRVDHLFVLKGYRGGVYKLQQWFLPQTLVLDARISHTYRMRLANEARRLGWRVHDLREDGALVVSTRDEK